MSVTRSPIRNESIRRREEQADARRTATIIGIICALGAFAFIAGVLTMGWVW